MKRIHLLAVLTLVAGSLIFSGCSKEEIEQSPSSNNSKQNTDTFLKNAPKRDMTTIQNHPKNILNLNSIDSFEF